MKHLLILVICLPLFATAQNNALVVEGAAPNLYLSHTVAPKENFYSVGRMYNTSPKEIAPYNKLPLEKGLNLNQTIKIPLNAENFVQENNSAADEALVPVYHIVKDKEGLYHISTLYNKVPVEKIKQWNNLKGDAVASGTKLIVGFLKVKKALSPLANSAKPVITTAIAKPAPVKESSKPVVSNVPLPVVKSPAKDKVPEVKSAEPVKIADKGVITDQQPVKKPATEPSKPVVSTHVAKNFYGGYFKNDFEKQTQNGIAKNETGTAAIFKSTSGWEDGKYYCLHNSAAPGTIVKVTNSTTGKSVYAKVLDLIPDITQNNGLLIRLSNAAAGELGAGDNKFECTVTYNK